MSSPSEKKPHWRRLLPGDTLQVGDVYTWRNPQTPFDLSNPSSSGQECFPVLAGRDAGTVVGADGLPHYRRLPAQEPGLPARRLAPAAFREACAPKSALPDSGARKEYETGAVRDASDGKGHFHSIPPSALRRIAKRFEDGARKYAKDNWMKGIPLSHYQDSLTRHTLAWAEGDKSEDHVGAILWNAAAMDWTEQQIAAGKLPPALDDLPYRVR
jgi:hypothetical protein